jgi:putative ABC transport system ATP-binding protein
MDTQRVAIGRALIAEPQSGFADDPTGSLDSVTGDQVLAPLVSRAWDQQSSVILATHQARVAAYADRQVTVLDRLRRSNDRTSPAWPGGSPPLAELPPRSTRRLA